LDVDPVRVMQFAVDVELRVQYHHCVPFKKNKKTTIVFLSFQKKKNTTICSSGMYFNGSCNAVEKCRYL